MLGVYILAAIVGGGLLFFSLLSGLEHDVGDVEVSGLDTDVGGADVGDVDVHGPDLGADHDLGHHGMGGHLLLALFRPRNLIFFLTAFGFTGMLLTWSDAAESTALALALAMGGGAWVLTWGVFGWLRRSESGVDAVGDWEIEGRPARVVLPVTPGERGRVVCLVADREVYVTARLASDVGRRLEPGTEVIVVSVEGGEAEVIPFDEAELPPAESRGRS
jgi:hypothetical protein